MCLNSLIAPKNIKEIMKNAELNARKLVLGVIILMMSAIVVLMVIFPVLSYFYNVHIGNMDTRQWYQAFQLK